MKNKHLIRLNFGIVISLVSIISCVSQNKKDEPSKYIDLNDNTKEITIRETDFEVLDGLLLEDMSASIYPQINKTIVLKDSVALKKMSVQHPDKSYTFHNSESTDKYRQLLALTKIPSVFDEQNLPIVVNGKLIAANDTVEINRLRPDSFKSIGFMTRSSVVLTRFNKIAMGAIVIQN